MPKVGRFFSAASGLLTSRPGVFSQETTPHSVSPQSTMRILAPPSATSHSPVGACASAGPAVLSKTAARMSL